MRQIGFALIAIAALIGLAWPWVQINIFSEKPAQYEFDQVGGQQLWQHIIPLTQADNPVRMRFKASFPVGATLPPLKVPVRIMISDSQGTLLSGIVSFPTQGISTGPEQEAVRGSQPLEFNILNDGGHAVFISLAPNANDGGVKGPVLASITASVWVNAAEINDDHKALAAIVFLCGLYLVVRYRRRTSRKNSLGARIWGRGDKKDGSSKDAE